MGLAKLLKKLTRKLPFNSGGTMYTPEFYQNQRERSQRSARIVLPLVQGFVQPKSVVDIGCGTGSWLSIWQDELGVADIQGVDGAYVDKAQLFIPTEKFQPHDLALPFDLGRRFDLAMSLEVAEHLSAERAETFVQNLTRLAPVVLFSAAIPHQGGTGHINEQWQDYWANLFNQFDYVPVDVIRRPIWDNPNVAWWYAQNTLMYVHRDELVNYPDLKAAAPPDENTDGLNLVHPRKYMEVCASKRKRAKK